MANDCIFACALYIGLAVLALSTPEQNSLANPILTCMVSYLALLSRAHMMTL